MYFAKQITNGRCVDDIIYINLSSFESELNSLFSSLLSASKLARCIEK